MQDIDIQATTVSLRYMGRGHSNRGTLSTLLTDALATPHRRFAANLIPTCPDRGHDDADQTHILWRCPFWDFLRQHHPVKWSPSRPPCVASVLSQEEDGHGKRRLITTYGTFGVGAPHRPYHQKLLKWLPRG